MRTVTFEFGAVKYSITMRSEHADALLQMIPPAARQMTMAGPGSIDVSIWSASATTYPPPPVARKPLTWEAFTKTMRAIRDGLPYDADALPSLHNYGYITGSQSDAAGVLLTERGRNMLHDLERDSADLERTVAGMAKAMFGGAPKL